jgi:hypothetical protein
MEIIEYINGKGGIMILGLIAITIFGFRKYKEKRYFKAVEKRIQEKNQKRQY